MTLNTPSDNRQTNGAPTINGLNNVYGSVGQDSQKTKDVDPKTAPLFGSFRLLISLMGGMILFLCFASQTSMSSAMVCMIDQNNNNHNLRGYSSDTISSNTTVTETNCTFPNKCHNIPRINVSLDTKEEDEWKFSWDLETQGWLVSSFFLGYYIVQIPSGIIVTRLGPTKSLVIGSMATGIFHLLSIPAARWNTTVLFLVRTLAGFACGCMLPGTFLLLANWCPRHETSMLFSITSNGIDLGNSFSFLLSLFGCETDFQGGWSIVFYVLGCFHFLIAVSILVWVTDFPATNRYIGAKECHYISINRAHIKKADKIPLGRILRSRPVWAFIIAQFATDWVVSMVVTQGPLYLRDVLHLPYWETNMLSSIPFLVSLPSGLIIGYLAMKVVDSHITSTTIARKATETFAKIMCAAPLLVLMVLPEGSCLRVFLIYACVAIGISGTYSGFMANPGDLSPAHAGFLTSLGQAFSMWTGFVIPVFTAYLTREKTQAGWQLVFIITITIQVISMVVYLLFGSGALQDWAESSGQLEKDEGENTFIVDKGDK